ncbi:MAG: hypothetical protein HZB72_15045 [Burkholderiales bacterium]|nr:hypothetical protein [Burkholderiales bacterium]MCH2241598.1 hypothetical protein [Aquabacterium sp.]
MTDLAQEIAAAAARLIVEEGLDYGAAKKRAVKSLGLPARSELPANELVEDEVRAYIDLFCADTQPAELAALRELAATWMERLAAFRPHLTGAVWRGTATRLNDIHLQLYCDDSKSAELALIDRRVDYDVGATDGPRGEPVDVLTLASTSPALGQRVLIHLTILDHDDLRGALKPDSRGRPWRGDLQALRALMQKA